MRRRRVAVLPFLSLAAGLLLCPSPTCQAASVEGALGAAVGRPLGETLSNVYPWLPGLALDVRLRHSVQISLSIQAALSLGQGTPIHGSLAEDPEGQLLVLPGHVVVEYSPARGAIQPYFGVGVGVLYVKESRSFGSPLGPREESRSFTRLSLAVLAGVEKAARTTPFAELHYQHANTAGVEEQSGSGVKLSTIQLRVGVRTRLK